MQNNNEKACIYCNETKGLVHSELVDDCFYTGCTHCGDWWLDDVIVSTVTANGKQIEVDWDEVNCPTCESKGETSPISWGNLDHESLSSEAECNVCQTQYTIQYAKGEPVYEDDILMRDGEDVSEKTKECIKWAVECLFEDTGNTTSIRLYNWITSIDAEGIKTFPKGVKLKPLFENMCIKEAAGMLTGLQMDAGRKK